MSIDLDTRLRTAADSLHQASDHLEPTEPPRDRRPLRVGALVVLLVVALVAVMVVRQDDGGDDPSVATNPDGIPRLIPGAAHEDMWPRGGVNLPGDTTEPGFPWSRTATLYGDREAEDPFAQADLSVSVRVVDYPDDGLGLGDSVDVRGKQGRMYSLQFGLTLEWIESEGLQVSLITHTLDREQLVAAAEALSIDGNSAVLDSQPAGVTAPLEEVTSLTSTSGLGVVGVPTAATGYFVAYDSENPYRAGGDHSQSVAVTMVEGGADQLAALRWLSRTEEAGSMAGRDGWVGSGSYPFGIAHEDGVDTPLMEEMSSFVWEESSGVVASVQGRGLSLDELETVVESLRPATGAEWRELRERQLAEMAFMAPELGGGAAGGYADGSWNVYLTADGTICGAVSNDSGTGVNCGTAAVALRAEDGTAIGVFGMVPPGAVSTREDSLNIRFVGADTDDWSGSGDEEEGEIYVAMFEDGQLPTAVEFRDENGEVVSTVPVEG